MTSDTEKTRDSSSSDSSGEKMLTPERLERNLVTIAMDNAQVAYEMQHHIAALSAKLETPVADGEVEELEAMRTRGDLDAHTILNASIGLNRRQAQEIERLKAVLQTVAGAGGDACVIGVGDGWMGLSTYCRAALSLNSVETREMKP